MFNESEIEVFCFSTMCWCQVLKQDDTWYAIISPDGVNTLVDKKSAKVRNKVDTYENVQ